MNEATDEQGSVFICGCIFVQFMRTKIVARLRRIFGVVLRKQSQHLDVIGLKHNFSEFLRPHRVSRTFNGTPYRPLKENRLDPCR